MRISTFFYAIGQGFKNLVRNRWFALAAIATITSCLFMFGVMAAVVINFRHVVQTVEEGVSVTVFFEPGTSEERIRQMKVEIEEREEVSDVTFISAEEAWDSFKDEYLGEYTDGFTENPLEGMDNLEINLKDVSRQGELISFLETMPEVREMNYSAVTADTLTGANRLIAYISVGIIGLLLAVSIFLINNTIATGITARKEEISIMKYIGATDFFVRAPFVIQGLIIGFIGSVIPVGVLYILYSRATEYVVGRFPTLARIMSFVPTYDIIRIIGPACLILGVGIGFLGGMFTVRRHLHV